MTLPDKEGMEITFDGLMDDITDWIADGRHDEVKRLLFRWGIQIQLLQALYEVAEPEGLDRLRAQLGDDA